MTQAGGHPWTLTQSWSPVQGQLCGRWWIICMLRAQAWSGGLGALSDQGPHFPSAAHCPLTQLGVSSRPQNGEGRGNTNPVITGFMCNGFGPPQPTPQNTNTTMRGAGGPPAGDPRCKGHVRG